MIFWYMKNNFIYRVTMVIQVLLHDTDNVIVQIHKINLPSSVFN